MTDVLLATCSSAPDGEQDGHLLVEALATRGVAARWAVWDDDGVAWADALVAVRSTWDYETRREELLSWARTVPRLLNSADGFAWNTDKSYLLDLRAADVPVVPTTLAADESSLRAAVDALGSPGVVKPRVGAGGRGVVPVNGPDDPGVARVGRGPWVVQPLVASIRTEGERAVFVLGREVVSQARKRPGGAEIRVHPQYGGSTRAERVEPEAADLAGVAVAAAERHLGHRLDYARIDLVRLADGTLAVGELEITEPGLYLPTIPGNADAFAELVRARLDANGVDRSAPGCCTSR